MQSIKQSGDLEPIQSGAVPVLKSAKQNAVELEPIKLGSVSSRLKGFEMDKPDEESDED